MTEIFIDNIKKVMEYLKIPPSKLAKKIGVSQSTVSRWINKKMGLTLENAVLLSKVLNVPFPELFKSDFDCEKYFKNKKE